jgi:predicted transcriptional regulator
MLVKVDALAKRMGQSRAAVINLAIFRLVEAEG